MLHVKPCLTNECELLYTETFSAALPEGIDVALYLDGAIIGGARVSFGEDKARLEGVCVLPSFRKKGYGDFLTRAVMDAYTRSLPVFEVAYPSDYFLPFGFRAQKDGMTIESEHIRFPSSCGGHH